MTEVRNVGLARALSKLGYCSRSQASKLIREGRVRLNGRVRRDPEAPVRLERDSIEADGAAIRTATRLYLMMNKPRGLVTTASDEKGRATVYSLFDKGLPWLGPVGRLDQASEGLLLFTNDSEWAARISDPASHIEKTYHVQIRGLVEQALVADLSRGVVAQGELLRATRARVLRMGQKNAWLEIVLDEGRNRQIRRMLENMGMEVLRLVRVSVGPLLLGTLAKGKYRALQASEKRALDSAMKSALTSRPQKNRGFAGPYGNS